MANSYNDEWNRKTESDLELLKNRLAKPVNTYSYKLVGPLYLKTTLNHIERASYNIYGTYDTSSKKAKLWVESSISYNCPDGVSNEISEETKRGDDNYDTYDEGTPSFDGFDFYRKEGSHYLKCPVSDSPVISDCVYNP